MPDLIGTPGHVRALLEALHAAGELVTMTPPRPAGQGQVVVRVELTPTRPRQHPARDPAAYPDKVGTGPRQGWHVPAAAFGAVVGAAVALVALLWWAVAWIWHWIGTHLPAIVGSVALLLGALLGVWWLLGRAGMCPGLHCPGCRCS